MNYYNTYNRIEIEITSKCNARCPGCSRNVNGITNPQLQVQDLSSENFIKYVPKEALKGKKIEFCGVFGDPVMHKDFITIVEHCRLSEPYSISIDTNGGSQPTSWWEKLATLGVEVQWSVDGHRKTNHLYRVNVKFDKILENMKAFSKAGGKGTWEYIVFDHNESEISIAKKEAHALGFDFNIRRNSRNNEEGYISYIKEKVAGKVVTTKFKVTQSNPVHKHSETETAKKEVQKDNLQISCLLYNDKKLFLGFDGRIWPCCWFHDIYNGAGNPQVEETSHELATHHKLKKLDSRYGAGWNSIIHNSWNDILGHEYYQKILPNTFDSTSPNFLKEEALPKCAKKCRKSGALRDVERVKYIGDK